MFTRWFNKLRNSERNLYPCMESFETLCWCLFVTQFAFHGGGYTGTLVWSHADLRLSHILYGDSWNIKNKCTAAAMFDSWLSRSTNVYFYEHFFHPFIFTYAYTQVTNKYLIIHSCWSQTHWAILYNCNSNMILTYFLICYIQPERQLFCECIGPFTVFAILLRFERTCFPTLTQRE